MGKDYWWYWPAPAFGRSSSSSTSTSTSSSKASTSSGCMCSLFQTFHFHPFHFSINQHQHKSPSSISQCLSKDGAQGPRNSLESQHGTASSKEQQHLQIPYQFLKIQKNIRIKTSRSMTRTRSGNYSSDFSSEMSFSPGTKTPTLVARLMGLDLLPENNSSSPNSSSSSTLSTPIINNKHGRSNNNNNNPPVHHNPKARQQHHHIQIMRHRHSTDSIGTIRSLSDTPRRSDVEHSRLSLQINKENIGVDENYLETPRFSFSKRKFDENNNNSSSSRSPSHYARQIVKQVKESVNRRVGITDITNTVKNREQESSVVQQIRFKKATKTSSNVNVNVNVIVNEACSPGKQSPRLSRFVDSKQNNPNSITKPSSPLTPKDQKPLSSSPTTTPLPIAHQIETQLSSKDDLQSKKSSSAPKCKRSRTTEKLGSGVNRTTAPQTSSIRKKQQESFVACTLSPTRPKTKNRSTHPLSSNLLLNTAPNLLPVKTHPSPLPTKIPQKQPCDTQEQKRSSAQLSSYARQKYKKDAIQTPATATTAGTATTAADDQGPEFEYITSILSRTGLRKATLPQIQYQWFSLSHPLDPSLFHNLEHHYPSSNPDKGCIFTQRDQLGPRCNRRLLFDLVDELLSEILARRKQERGLLVETVWRKVRSFPGAKCEVLEDIDGLIEMEEMERKVKEEREEGLVMEIGRSIMETLVHETVTVFML
nr:ras guanine nucleotide exchange factor Y isoform X1 [Arachis hypogaea]